MPRHSRSYRSHQRSRHWWAQPAELNSWRTSFYTPGEAFHIRELARLLAESPGSLLPDLRRLEAIRLLQTERVGKVRYSLDQKHPLYRDLLRMILTTTAADAVLREALQPVRDIELAVLYSSFANGDATSRCNAMLLAGRAVMFSEGYRPTTTGGHAAVRRAAVKAGGGAIYTRSAP